MTDIVGKETAELANRVLSAARLRGWSLVTAESCTAGLIATALSAAEGAATCFHGGIIAYTKEMKRTLLGVSPALLAERSAVCAEVAQAMASGAIIRTPADAAVAITGVAGPEPDDDGNPVGLVFVAVVTPDNMAVRHFDFEGDRESVLQQGIQAALELFLEHVEKHVGTVDRIEGKRVKLMKKDSGADHTDHHHFLDSGLIAGIEAEVHTAAASRPPPSGR